MPEAEKKLYPGATVHTDVGTFTILTDVDNLEGYINCPQLNPEITAENLREILSLQFKITYGLLEDSLARIVTMAQKNLPAMGIIVARGTPVVEGRDAYIDFAKKPVGLVQQEKAEEVDRSKVDYREIKTFDNVKEGDHIATYMPPVEGQGGSDIFNKVIPVRKPQDISIEAGANVSFDGESRKFYATAAGYVNYAKRQLSVEQVYHVKGSVDLSHGNIRFVGRVEVDRDVPDEYEITALEGIAIGGTAEACVLKSGKEITIRGGVTGKGKGKIELKGNFTAHFLNEITLICGGDVMVQKEIVNSKVYALGRVIVDRGAIIGSEVVALKGIVCQDAGSELGVKTLLVAGVDYHVHETLHGINRELVKCRQKQQALLNRLGPMLTKALKSPTVDNRLRQEADDLMLNAKALQRQLVKLEEESGDLSESFADRAITCSCVLRNLHPGVVAITGKFERENKHPVMGPLSFRPDEERQQVLLENGNLLTRLWEEEALRKSAGADGEAADG
jgi:uncharacterized protein (DUF342 family)